MPMKLPKVVLENRVVLTKRRKIDKHLMKWAGCSVEENTWSSPQRRRHSNPLSKHFGAKRGRILTIRVDGRLVAQPMSLVAVVYMFIVFLVAMYSVSCLVVVSVGRAYRGMFVSRVISVPVFIICFVGLLFSFVTYNIN